MKILLIVLIFLSTIQASFKTYKYKQVVVDLEHYLMWQDTKDNITLKFNHQDSVKYCQDLKHSSYSNWRIPTSNELKSIVKKTNKPNHINKAFQYTLNKGYWTKEVLWRTLWFYANYVSFKSGTIYYDNKNVLKFVRCVRDD